MPLTYPKKITITNIVNVGDDKVIREYEGRYNSEDFRSDFLKRTVNGKFICRITEELGMEIYKLEVISSGVDRSLLFSGASEEELKKNKLGDLEIIKKNHPCSYSVVVHFRPAKGNPDI